MDVNRLLALDWWVHEQEALRLAGRPSAWDQNVWFEMDEPGNERVVEYGEADEGYVLGEYVIRVPSCGTVCCIAGHVAMQDGWTLSDLNRQMRVDPETGLQESISSYAARILGLESWEASRLFDANNSAEQVHAFIEDLIAHQ